MEFYHMNAEMLPRIHFVDDTVIKPPYVHKRRKAGEYIVYLVKHGEMFLTEDGAELTLGPGDFCVLDKDRTHQGVRESTCEYYYVHFSHAGFAPVEEKDEGSMMSLLIQERQEALKSNIFAYDRCDNNIIYLPKHWHIPYASDFIRVDELMQQAIRENYNPLENYKILCAAKIQEAFILISRCFITAEKERYLKKLPAYYPLVQDMLDWLGREYGGAVTGEALERRFGNNYDYMNRVFKKVTGQTVFQYLTQLRISHAKILLLHTSLRMAEVGEKVGFPDEYYFNRVFKKYVGVPPATYARTVSLED